MEIISFDTRGSAIAKNAFWGFLLQVLLKFKGVILLPIVVHFLSPETLGEWKLITTTVSVLLPVISLNLFDGSGMFFSSDVDKVSVRKKYYSVFNLALMLEANPNLSPRHVRDILCQTARNDEWTGPLHERDSMSNIWVRSQLPTLSHADLSVQTTLHNTTGCVKEVLLSGIIQPGNISFTKKITINSSDTTVTVTPNDCPSLSLDNPQLWWPNGYGSQEMYTMRLSVMDGNRCSDELSVPFGIRELSYELSVWHEGEGELRIDYSPTDLMPQGTIPSTPTYFTCCNLLK